MKTHPNKTYAKLLEYADNDDFRFKNKLFVHDETKSVMALSKHRLLAIRPIYNETKVLARLIGGNSLEYKENIFVSSDSILPDVQSIIPDQNSLDSKTYARIRLVVPNWIKSISKREKKPYVSFIFGETPVLAISEGYENSTVINANFLKPFCGENIDVYVPKTSKDGKPFVFMPSENKIDTANWFSLVMPIRLDKKENLRYF